MNEIQRFICNVCYPHRFLFFKELKKKRKKTFQCFLSLNFFFKSYYIKDCRQIVRPFSLIIKCLKFNWEKKKLGVLRFSFMRLKMQIKNDIKR